MKMPRIVVIGGGTGSYVTLSGLKQYPYDLSAIVTMMDDGGSTGKLRDQLGVLPPGDFRQCLIALSEAPDVWRKLFAYRFDSGDLAGHNMGNILISALEKISSSYQDVVQEAHQIMAVSGRVVPVTFDTARLKVVYQSGRELIGEKFLDERSADNERVASISLQPGASLNPEVADVLAHADYIIIGPGDLYSSIISVALVSGFKDAFRLSRAKVIFIMNLMTKSSQTPSYCAQDHVNDITKYFGRRPDVVLQNSDPIPPEMQSYYRSASNDIPVVGSVEVEKVIATPLLAREIFEDSQKLGQTFAHSLLRHDSEKVAAAIRSIVE